MEIFFLKKVPSIWKFSFVLSVHLDHVDGCSPGWLQTNCIHNQGRVGVFQHVARKIFLCHHSRKNPCIDIFKMTMLRNLQPGVAFLYLVQQTRWQGKPLSFYSQNLGFIFFVNHIFTCISCFNCCWWYHSVMYSLSHSKDICYAIHMWIVNIWLHNTCTRTLSASNILSIMNI